MDLHKPSMQVRPAVEGNLEKIQQAAVGFARSCEQGFQYPVHQKFFPESSPVFNRKCGMVPHQNPLYVDPLFIIPPPY